jgi:outer membrane protein OmpU
MKKVLFATTALIATAGVASADITLTGDAAMGMRQTATTNSDTFLDNEVDFNIVASGTADNGYTFGASMDVDGDMTADSANAADAEVYISGGFGKISFGNQDNAADGVGLADVGYQGVGVDDDIEALDNRGSADINYSTSINGINVVLSYAMGTTAGEDGEEGDFGVLVSTDINGLGVKVAYTSDNSATTNDTATAVQLSYAVNGLTLGALFADNGVNSGSGFSATYAVDSNLSLTAVWAQTDEANNKDDMGVGFSYNMGGGLALVGGVGRVDGTTVGTSETGMELGLTMSF